MQTPSRLDWARNSRYTKWRCDSLAECVKSLKSTAVLLFITFLVCSGAIADELDADSRAAQFLAALQASWHGSAERTPIGPRPYDIIFERRGGGEVAGATGDSSVHHWAFYLQDENLVLRFLSTFGGNRDPILLYAEQWDERGILFRAKQPELLSLRVSVTANRLAIDVYHWEKIHVSIRLTRIPADSE